MFQHHHFFFRNFADILDILHEEGRWNQMNIDTPQKLPEDEYLEIFTVGREIYERIKRLNAREKCNESRIIWNHLLVLNLGWKRSKESQVVIRYQGKDLGAVDLMNNQWPEKSAHAMEPNSIWLEFPDTSPDGESGRDITERIRETENPKKFCPRSFLDVPPEDLHLVSVVPESLRNGLDMCLDSTENSRVVTDEEDFLRMIREYSTNLLHPSTFGIAIRDIACFIGESLPFTRTSYRTIFRALMEEGGKYI